MAEKLFFLLFFGFSRASEKTWELQMIVKNSWFCCLWKATYSEHIRFPSIGFFFKTGMPEYKVWRDMLWPILGQYVHTVFLNCISDTANDVKCLRNYSFLTALGTCEDPHPLRKGQFAKYVRFVYHSRRLLLINYYYSFDCGKFINQHSAEHSDRPRIWGSSSSSFTIHQGAYMLDLWMKCIS